VHELQFIMHYNQAALAWLTKVARLNYATTAL